MKLIKEKYYELCNTKSDINEHLPTLLKYASKCDHITEFGVRDIVSTYALLLGMPSKMISYDINQCPVDKLNDIYHSVEGFIDFQFKIGNTLEVEIEETNLLFIDTLHNYNQLSEELKLHGNKANKYIIFHDTTSYEWYGESYDGIPRKGIWPAIEEFLAKNNHWKIEERFKNNNGLTVLSRS